MSQTDVKHPAKFSDVLIPLFAKILRDEFRGRLCIDVLDPFAGTGKIHQLRTRPSDPRPIVMTYGIEIEPEWAGMHQGTMVGDATDLPDDWTMRFDAIVTSPTYGNRMADHHDARDGTVRHTYKHTLGRDLHPNNSGAMPFGVKYHEIHAKAWREAKRVLRPGGLFVLNISNFIKRGEEVDVAGWHTRTLQALGFVLETDINVETPRMGFGANAKLRVPFERVLVFRLGRKEESC